MNSSSYHGSLRTLLKYLEGGNPDTFFCVLVFEAFEAEEGWVLNSVVEESLNSAEPIWKIHKTIAHGELREAFFFF